MATPTVRGRMLGSLWGAFAGDALAMPVHWMYDLNLLQRDYGTLTAETGGYVAPKDHFEGSIMSLSNTGGGGRGSDKGSIVGDVILHGKKKYWKKGGNYHYHLGLHAGENTLEAQLARLLIRIITETNEFDTDDFLSKYIAFMTTPGSHNDTYASTCHRMFFANYVQGTSPGSCADNDGHNVDTIDALTLTVPVVLLHCLREHGLRPPLPLPGDLHADVLRVVHCLRGNSNSGSGSEMDPYVLAYADLLFAVLGGRDLREAVEDCGRALYGPSVSIRARVEASSSSSSSSSGSGRDPMVACYISSSFPALLHFAYKYADSVEGALLASANAGGENVARGFALGALLGAAHGGGGHAGGKLFPGPRPPSSSDPPSDPDVCEESWLVQGLFNKEELEREFAAFLSA